MKTSFLITEISPPSEGIAASENSEGGKNNWNDHKSMVTVWLLLLFALWVVLTTALAVIARHGEGRKTQPPSVIAAAVIV